MNIPLVILAVGALVFLAHLFSSLFDKTRVPDVLPLVFLGLILGPILGWIRPEDFGKVGGIFTTIALVVILFESGLGLDFSSLGASMARGLWLTLVNFVLSMAVIGVLCHFLYGTTLSTGLLLGAILGGTSSAIVIPMIQKIKLGEDAKTSLLLESTFSDVLCIVMALGLMRALQSHQVQVAPMIGQILASFLMSAVFGTAAGFLWSTLLNRVRRLENSGFATPAFVFIVYGFTELLGYSGGIAALAFGIILGNINKLNLPLLRRLKSFRPIQLNPVERTLLSEMVFLLKTFFFIYIGLNIQTHSLFAALTGFSLTLSLFLLRIPVVHLSFSRKTTRFEASIAAAMVPKGLAAAVLASIPLQMGMPDGQVIQEIVYAVILCSITLTALLTFLIEQTPVGRAYAGLFPRFAPDARLDPHTA